MRTVLVPYAVIAACLVTGHAAAAEAGRAREKGADEAPFEIVGQIDQKNVERLAQGPGRAGTWIPYYLELRANRDRPVTVEFAARISSGNRGDKDTLTVRRSIPVPEKGTTRAWIHIPIPAGEGNSYWIHPTCKAEGVTRDLPSVSYALLGGDPQTMQVAMIVAGDPERTRTSLSPWGESGPTVGGRIEIDEDRIVRLDEKALPDRWIGYSRANLLLLRNPDLRALEPAQVEAIRRWVFLGGRVVFVPSNRGEIFSAPLLRTLIGEGAEIGAPAKKPYGHPDPLWSVQGKEVERLSKNQDLGEFEKEFTLVDPVKVAAARAIYSSKARLVAGEEPPEEAQRLYGEVAYGYGSVGFLTFDDLAIPITPATIPFRQALWGAIIGPGADQPSAAPLLSGVAGEIAGAVRAGLTRELGIWFIALLVVAYLVVIGPGTYLVLKRLGKLPAIVWVEPIIVVIYIGIIAATAYITKGVLTKVREVSVIDHLQGEDFAASRNWLGIFSAGDERYRIAAPGKDGIEAVGDGRDGGEVLALDLDPTAGPAILDRRIAQWATAVFAAAGLGETPPGAEVEAKVELAQAGEGQPEAAAVLLQNGTSHAFRRTFFATGNGQLFAGPALPPGGEARVAAPFTRVNLAPAVRNPRSPGEKEGPETRDVLEGDDLLRTLLRSQMSKGGEGGAAFFIGEIDRSDRDFKIDRASTVDRRVDLYVERRR